MVGASELLVDEYPSEIAETILQVALRLSSEIAVQRCLSQGETGRYQPFWNEYSVGQTLNELRKIFVGHPAAMGKMIDFSTEHSAVVFITDISLLLRIVCNMVINALEATPDSGTVRVWLENKDGKISFCVWNEQEISESVKMRIFQRNFSTKKQVGRGTGTYSMKFFGEKILGGRVSFTSSKTTELFSASVCLPELLTWFPGLLRWVSYAFTV